MTESQKKLAIIAVTVIIALILLLRGNRNTTNVTNATPDINVLIPAFNMPPRTPIAINIPGLPGGSQYEFQAISPCMCNGSSTSGVSDLSPVTIVFNEGSSGPNIYDYTTNTPDYSSGFIGIPA